MAHGGSKISSWAWLRAVVDRADTQATAVGWGPDAGVLILGPSGAGKSSLALQLMQAGAQLVGDDRVTLGRGDSGAYALAIAGPGWGLVESRGVGILKAEPLRAARLKLVVDLNHTETARLPERRVTMVRGVPVPVAFGPVTPHFPISIKLWVLHGRHA
ncbi:MAG TPA: serine kinase [Paracoccaceae bacterium]|nr:serine kinase [Paracoccaceae bacterium]HMO72874.1 serine kinase [Paracoccaceae bacterium]